MRTLLAGLVAGLLLIAPAATAAFLDAPTSNGSFTTTSLAPASALTGTTSCNGTLSTKVNLSWTATPSTLATGHIVERWQGGTMQNSTTVTPRTTTTLQQTGLPVATTYTWRVKASFQSWTSSEITVTRTTPTLCL